MALANHVIPGEVYAWTAVLVLPINSALNPFLYTLSAIIGRGVSRFISTVRQYLQCRMLGAVAAPFPFAFVVILNLLISFLGDKIIAYQKIVA